MSHFSVLVIGEDPVKLLAPYHEFECTGYDDEYVQAIDETEDYREEYEEDTKRMLLAPDGERYDYYHRRFYTKIPTPEEQTGAGKEVSEIPDPWHEIPEGWEEIEVPVKELMTFTQWVLGDEEEDENDEWRHVLRPGDERAGNHQYRFIELDEKGQIVRIVRRTNPNKKWDYWVLGGRFGRFFKLKPDVEFDIENVSGGDLYTKEASLYPESFDENDPWTKKNRQEWVEKLTASHSTDHARVRDIDFEATRDRAELRAREDFAKWRAIYEKHGRPLPFSHFEELADEAIKRLEKQGIADEQVKSLFYDYKVSRKSQERERAGKSYREQAAIAAEREEYLCGIRQSPIDWFGYDEEAYVQKMRNMSMVPYAVVKDGEWFAKGEMGWFACSDDHMTDEEWCKKVNELYDELPEDALLTLVDCHI